MQEEIDRRKLESRTVMNPKKEQLVKKSIKVGIAIGGGTGLQLTKIFEDCLKKMAQKADVDITFEKSAAPYYSSYEDIKKFENTKDQSIKEAESLHDQYTKWFGSYDAPTIDTVFRTSVNAEALYLFRQKVGAIKEILIPTDNGNRILLIRDQTEGFYSNTSYEITDEEITFSGKYSKKHLQKVIALISARARRVFEGSDYLKWYIAKHHLFGYTLEVWCKEIDRSFDLIQPDTGLTQTFEYLKRKNEKNLLILASNEVGDLMYEPFMESLQSSAPKLDLYSRSDFLNPPFNGKLVEYQTCLLYTSPSPRDRG